MNPLRNLLTITAAFVCAATNLSAQQNLVTNGDFEDGTFEPEWQFQDASQNTAIRQNTGGFVGSYEGARWANLGADTEPPTGQLYSGVLTQTISVTPGANYTLSFALAADLSLVPGAPAPSNFFQALFDGSVVFTIEDLTPANVDQFGGTGAYTLYSFPVQAGLNDSTANVEFRYHHNNDFFRLDAVSVPEPSTVTLLAMCGVGGVVIGYRRARRSVKATQV